MCKKVLYSFCCSQRDLSITSKYQALKYCVVFWPFDFLVFQCLFLISRRLTLFEIFFVKFLKAIYYYIYICMYIAVFQYSTFIWRLCKMFAFLDSAIVLAADKLLQDFKHVSYVTFPWVDFAERGTRIWPPGSKNAICARSREGK